MPELFSNPSAAEIGERIRLYREQHGLSQKLMAEQIGITPSQLCRYEKGTEIPSTPILARIAAFMQRTIDYVYNGRLEEIVGKIDPLLREPFIELQGFSEECRRAVYESAYAHMSKEIMLKRARMNPDTGIIPGRLKSGGNDS
ncbi:MAG TPA: helix-turn-helix transcriptional regulator [Vicinamibacterales bacterium]